MKHEKIIVRWKDSWGVNPDWESVEDALNHDYCDIETSGYLLKENESRIIIAQSVDDTTGMVCGVIVIPIECVLERIRG